MLLPDDPVNAFMPYPARNVPSAETGPLAGLTVAIKDIFDVPGYPTGCGNPLKLAESPIHSEAAPIVQKILDAGARFVGKTQTDELAFSLNGQNKHIPSRSTAARPAGSPAARRQARPPRSPRDCAISRWAPTPAARCAPRPAIAACGASARRMAACRWTASCRSPHPSTRRATSPTALRFSAGSPRSFLGDDATRFGLTRLMRAEDAFARLHSGREHDALRPVVAKAEAALGPAEPVTVAPDGLDKWYWTFRHLPGG
jgi:amidase